MAKSKSVETDLQRMTATVEDFCRWIESLPARAMRPQDWGPREVLSHLVFWHEYYVTRSEAGLSGKSLPLFDGTFFEINAEAVAKFRRTAPDTLTRRFRSVNRRLCALAGANDPGAITFQLKEKSKTWRLGHLIPAAERHICTHLQKMKKEYRSDKLTTKYAKK